jgi:hypothetical protein
MADPVPPQQDLLGRWLAHVEDDHTSAGQTSTPPAAGAPAAAGRHRGTPVPEAPPEGASLHETVRAAVLASLEQERAAHVEPRPSETSTGPVEVHEAHRTHEAEGAVRADHAFAPRRGTQRLLTVVALAAAVVAVLALRAALAEPGPTWSGLAVIAGLASLALWAVRASATPARLRVQLGQLEIVRGSRRDVVDLAGDYTDVEVHGRPGHRGWRVVFPRREGEPVVVDASVVDAHEFMRVLRAYRPDTGAGVPIQ